MARARAKAEPLASRLLHRAADCSLHLPAVIPNFTDFFAWNNPLLQSAGILVPSINKKGETTLTARNSHQTRRAMAEAQATKLGIQEATEDSESCRIGFGRKNGRQISGVLSSAPVAYHKGRYGTLNA